MYVPERIEPFPFAFASIVASRAHGQYSMALQADLELLDREYVHGVGWGGGSGPRVGACSE